MLIIYTVCFDGDFTSLVSVISSDKTGSIRLKCQISPTLNISTTIRIPPCAFMIFAAAWYEKQRIDYDLDPNIGQFLMGSYFVSYLIIDCGNQSQNTLTSWVKIHHNCLDELHKLTKYKQD